MEQEQENKIEEESSSTAFRILVTLSVLSFLTSLILLWQGLVKIAGLSLQYETVRKLVYSLLTFQNSGVELLAISFFLLMISIQFSIYALIVKK